MIIKTNNFTRALVAFLTVIFLINTTGCTIVDNISTQITHRGLDPTALHQSLKTDFDNPNCPPIEGNNSYRFGTGDDVRIHVFSEESLTGKHTLPDTGRVNLPLIGETTLAGCSIKQAEELLYHKFSDGYLVDPSITVSVAKYSPFYIIGEVREPDKYDYNVNMTILEAVAIAGGFTYRANKKVARVLTNQSDGQTTYQNLSIEQKIHPGDVIIIKERFF